MVVLGPCYRLGLSRRMRPLRAAGLASAGPGSGPGPGPPRSRGGAVGRAGTRGGGGGRSRFWGQGRRSPPDAPREPGRGLPGAAPRVEGAEPPREGASGVSRRRRSERGRSWCLVLGARCMAAREMLEILACPA